MRLFEVDCNFIWLKKSAVIISKFALNQNRNSFKTEFFFKSKKGL